MKNFKDFCNEEQWSGDVETKKHPKEGLFAEGTAKEISDWCIKSHKDLKGAMASINFYINRAGDNLTAERKKVLEDAKELVHKHFGVNESTNNDLAKDIFNLLSSAWFETFYENEFMSFIEGDEDALPKEKIISMIASKLK